MCPWHIATSRFDWSVIKSWINLKMQINIAERPIWLMHLCQDLDSVTRRWRSNSSCGSTADVGQTRCSGDSVGAEGQHLPALHFSTSLQCPRKYPVWFNNVLCVSTQIHARSHPCALTQGLRGALTHLLLQFLSQLVEGGSPAWLLVPASPHQGVQSRGAVFRSIHAIACLHSLLYLRERLQEQKEKIESWVCTDWCVTSAPRSEI